MPADTKVLDLRRSIQIATISAVTVLVLFILYLGASYAAAMASPAPLRQSISQALASGDLTSEDRLHFDRVRGDHQYNDCLILTMSILRSGHVIEDALSPLMCIKADARATPVTVCGMLGRAIAAPPDGGCTQQRYHRYLHGHRILATLLLSRMGLANVRLALKACAYLLLACLAMQAVLPKAASPFDRRSTLIIAAGFAAFFGLDFFATSLSHGPADIVLLAFVLFAARTNLLDMSRNAFAILVSAFGALTAIFEFLTGGLPLGLAILIGAIGLQVRQNHATRQVTIRCIDGVGIYLASFSFTFALKLAMTWAVHGNSILDDFRRQLLHRVSSQLPAGQPASIVDLVNALRWNLSEIAWGHEAVGYAAMAASAVAALAGVMRIVQRRRAGANLTRDVLIALSALVVPAWFLLFMNHTIEHAWFMVRIAVWPAICCWLVALAPSIAVDRSKPTAEKDQHGRTSEPVGRHQTFAPWRSRNP